MAIRRRRVAATVAMSVMATLGFSNCSTGAGAPAPAADSVRSALPPNIVLYIVDDLGWADTGITVPGHTNPRGTSPMLDQMARDGVSFTAATALPTCSPTRASLLTGTQPTDRDNGLYSVNGLYHPDGETRLRVPKQKNVHQTRRGDYLGRDAQTIAETLKQGGYTTAAFGKFHVTQNGAQVRRWHGFDVNYGGTSAGNPGIYHAQHGRFDPNIGRGLDRFAQPYTAEYIARNVAPYSRDLPEGALDELVGQRKNVLDALGDAGEEYLNGPLVQSGKPFFMQVGTYGVHAPINTRQPRPDLVRKYGGRLAPVLKGRVATRVSYSALLEEVDQGVARLVNTLETTPDPREPSRTLAQNTVVFVTSDNGGLIAATADNGPYRSQKASILEGGVRVPWFVWSANKALVPRGGMRDQAINATDFYPTAAEVAGVRVPNPKRLDGRSWWKAVADPEFLPLDDTSSARYARVVHLPGYRALVNGRPETTIRDGKWKAHYLYESGTWELFDLSNDPGERTDLARSHPETTSRLAHTMLQWARIHRPPLPSVKQAGAVFRINHFVGRAYARHGVVTVRGKQINLRQGSMVPIFVPRSFRRQQPAVWTTR